MPSPRKYPGRSKQLSEKAIRCVMGVLSGLTLKEAFLRAGYKFTRCHPQMIRSYMEHPTGQKLVREHRAKMWKKYEPTAKRVIQELSLIAFADIAEAFDDEGNLKSPRKMPEEIRRTMSKFKAKTTRETASLKKGLSKQFGKPQVDFEVSFCDKVAALGMLAKHFGLLAETDEEARRRAAAGLTIVMNPAQALPQPSTLVLEQGSTNGIAGRPVFENREGVAAGGDCRDPGPEDPSAGLLGALGNSDGPKDSGRASADPANEGGGSPEGVEPAKSGG